MENALEEEINKLEHLKNKVSGVEEKVSPVKRAPTSRISLFQSKLQDKQEIKALANAGQ